MIELLYKTVIRPVVMYGSESWNMTSNDEFAIGVFERKVLRTILGPKRKETFLRARATQNYITYSRKLIL